MIILYTIEFSDTARKDLLKLQKEIQKRIWIALDRIKFNPKSYVTKIVGIDAYRLRVGDYRIIMDIQHDKLMILIVKVGHRSSIYGSL